MRYLLIALILLCGAANAYAAKPQRWCSADGLVIVQSGETFTISGKKVSAYIEHAGGDDRAAVLVYGDKFLMPCP